MTSVPPDFNTSMKTIWEELWESMPQTGSISTVIGKLLLQYRERCQSERKRRQDGDQCPLALLPVSYAQAKDWLRNQQKVQSEAISVGAVNESAREVVTELSYSLTEQSTSTAHLLEQPARPASPVIPPPQLLLGPEPVTDETRAEERKERAEERRKERGAEIKPARKSTQTSRAPKPKKAKTIPPELEERQQRAKTRMLQLGVSAVEVRMYV